MTDEARTSLEVALPAYEIAGKLGQGAFGVVYEARHAQLGRQVAIKQLPQSYAEDADVRERFVAEAQMVASLDHPHIVPVYDFVESEGSRFLIMERCQGSVSERFKDEGLVTDEACAAVLACLAALDFAHEKGLLHRDVKPENLMYDTKGVVKLGDFGIARDLGADTRRTATGMIVGTPAYMSPEQCRGDELTPASDVYSVAMMGYELLTGALPFPDTGSINGLLAHHLVTEPTPLLTTRPELPGVVGEVVDRALAKDLGVRYATALEFATALARACVTAFGSGWLRRRRFVLHWPEIIAETERTDDDSPRTGTIRVRAGDITHAYITPDDAAVEPTAEMQPEPTPVAVVDPHAVAPTAVLAASAAEAPAVDAPAVDAPGFDTPPVATPPATGPAATAPPAAAPPAAAPPTSPQTLPSDPVAEPAGKSRPNLALIGGVVAVLAAIIVGVVLFAGRSGDGELTVTEADPSTATPAVATEPTTAPAQVEPTALATEPTAAPAEPTPLAEAPVAAATTAPAATPTPFVVLLTERPADLDSSDASSPFAPTPCPEDQERVACIFAAISVDEETGELLVPYFTEGFVPQLEPADYHVHFYLDSDVGGDETKAGRETPGGAWKPWDAPFPATSFGGENGRTLWTLPDFEATDARNLCSIVADAEQRAIPKSGNCAPLLRPGNDEDTLRLVNRLSGQFIGSCSLGSTAIVPNDWRWVDLVNTPITEAARFVRPAEAAETQVVLQDLVDGGAVLWAGGPAVDDFVVNLSIALFPGDFELNDDPDEVRTTLNGLGVTTRGSQVRTIGGRDYLTTQIDNGDSTSGVYVVPDFGYAMVMTFTAPPGAGLSELADSIATTITGC